MIKNLAILVVVMIFGFELYISTKGSQHRKKKRIRKRTKDEKKPPSEKR